MLKYAVHNALSLYEDNFSKLMLLLEGLEQVSDTAVLEADGLAGLYLAVLDRSAYTTTIALSHSFGIDEALLRSLHMKIRIYHDAQVAEVLAYQHAVHFLAFYPYPNPRMFQPYEKRRVNQFLGEWLQHCLKSGYRMPNVRQSSLPLSMLPPARNG